MFEVTTLLQGFAALVELQNLAYLMIGFFVGVVFGAVPGLTSMLAITLLLPMTFSMPVVPALVMCMGIYMAGIYAGSITAITINIPGAPSSVMTAIDGYVLMKKGEGARALGHATIASAIGGTIGALLLILVSPLAAQLALLVRTVGKFSLVFFALVVIGLVDSKNWIKGAASTVLGLMVATIGMDLVKPVPRFTFGSENLMEGIQLVPLIIGAFAISELLLESEVKNEEYQRNAAAAIGMKHRRRDFFPSWKDYKEIGLWRYLKSSLIGYFVGVLPGAGGSMAAFVSYIEGKRSSKHPELYGKGSVEGIACAESSNNACCGGALVPMLSFGIPGDGTTAIILGVLMIYGLVPGPDLLTKDFHIIAPMYAALLVSALILLPLSLFLFGPYYVKIVKINRLVLYGGIALVSIMGAYSSTYSVFQMLVALVVGVGIYFLRKDKYPSVPFILGALLGPTLEDNLRRALTISRGNPLIFLTEPDSLVFLLLTVAFVGYFLKNKRLTEK